MAIKLKRILNNAYFQGFLFIGVVVANISFFLNLYDYVMYLDGLYVPSTEHDPRFLMILSMVVLIILLIGLIILQPSEKKYVDHLFTEITLFFILGGPFGWLLALNRFHNVSESDIKYIFAFITAIFTAWTGIFILSLVRKFKTRQLIKTTFIYKCCSILLKAVFSIKSSVENLDKIKNRTFAQRLVQRQIIFIASSAANVFVFFILTLMQTPWILLPIVVELILVFNFLNGNTESFEALSLEYEDMVQKGIKSERMKVELITNLSHDLKTPLTSIISYVDLMKNDPETHESSQKYLRVIEEKSQVLNHMVMDLFDLSKSTSGNLNLSIEELDLKRLVEQVAGDFDEEISSSTLEFKYKFPDALVIIRSDGMRLYRVFQNLFDNILKYALPGTRVYIEMLHTEDEVVVTLKNTSFSEILLTPDEILQRFQRADTSRTTEGSGLGLSIAESFTKACGGTLKLYIDGDLFKVELTFPYVKDRM